ncbi:MAG: sugar ABC transporter ATP-binding protein [Solirubrobacteraceae bacterium]
MPQELLHLSHASQTFGAVTVLSDVSLRLREGEICALLGQNGSGKSTLIKILSGYNRPDAGTTLEIGGHAVALPCSAGDPLASRLSFVHQDLGLLDEMSVIENFLVGDWRKLRRSPVRPIRWRAERRRVGDALRRFGLECRLEMPVGELREGDRAIVAIARSLSTLPTGCAGVLVLDEPAASLPRAEVQLLLNAMRRVRAEGHGVLLVSHRLDEVREIADTVVVLRDGVRVLGGAIGSVTDAELTAAIVGRHVDAAPAEGGRVVNGPKSRVLSVESLCGGVLQGVSFELCSAEVLGLTGLGGMGQDDVAKLLLGLERVSGGRVCVAGKAVRCTSPRAALRRGIAYLPPNRTRGGALAGATVTENMTMPVLGRYRRRGRIHRRSERITAEEMVRKFDVRPPRPDVEMRTLSGGNQQKVLLAKLENTNAEILILHEPTHGVDVGAREQVLAAIRTMSASGRAVLVISKEYEDLERLCDRILVFRNGRVQETLTGTRIDRHEIASACLNARPEAMARR